MECLLREATGGEWSWPWREPRWAADGGGSVGTGNPGSSRGTTCVADAALRDPEFCWTADCFSLGFLLLLRLSLSE